MRKFIVTIDGKNYEVGVEEVKEGVPAPVSAPAPAAVPTAPAAAASPAASANPWAERGFSFPRVG